MADLVIKISGDITEFNDAMDAAKKKTEALNEGLKTVAEISAVAFAVLSAEVYESAKAFGETEAASRKLNLALQNQGLYSDELVKSYKEQAEAISSVTGFDVDAITTGQAKLQSMVGQTKVTKEMTSAAVELGNQSGNVEQGFQDLGRAFAGNTRILKQYGITVNETLPYHERMAAIVDAVNQKLSGQAEASNQGMAAMRGLKTSFEEIQKAIGEQFAPAIESAIKGLTEFFQWVKQHPEIINMAVALTTAGLAVAVIVGAIATGTIVFVQFRAALIAAGVATEVMTLGIQALVGSTGIGLLIIVAVELYQHWADIWPRMQQIVQGFVVGVTELFHGLGDILDGVLNFDVAKITAGLDRVKAALAAGINKMNAELPKVEVGLPGGDQKQDAAKLAAANKAEADRNALEQRSIAARKAAQDAMLRDDNMFSTEELAIKKEQAKLLGDIANKANADIVPQLQAKYALTVAKEKELNAQEIAANKALDNDLLANNRAYQQMSDQEKTQFNTEQRAKLLSSVQTEKTIHLTAMNEELKTDIDAHNKFLKEQQKYGTAYATISKAQNSEMVTGFKSATNDMVQFQSSSNEQLKSIGKAAAVADIIIKTASSAMNIYNGFSMIPIVGPALGVAGAALAVAFGAEQIGNVTAAAEGGLMMGGIPGMDSIPVLAQQGELIAPKKNFNEVINAVANQRLQQNQSGASDSGGSSGGGSAIAHLILELKGNLMDLIDINQVQRQNLKTTLRGS